MSACSMDNWAVTKELKMLTSPRLLAADSTDVLIHVSCKVGELGLILIKYVKSD